MFKILIVDPNEPFRRALKKVLTNRFSFVDILEAVDVIEASAMVQDFDPNLIFIEIHLPSGSGLDLARRIKSRLPEIVIVILTSYNLPEYKKASEESGIEHFVPKDDWTGKDMVDLVRISTLVIANRRTDTNRRSALPDLFDMGSLNFF